MAPVGMQVLGWAAARSISPELILASLFCLLALIKLLAICAQCNRKGFELEEKLERERSPSSLVQVVKLEEAEASRDNPSFEYGAKDEQVPRPTSGNGSLHMSPASGKVQYTSWRSHTLTYSQEDSVANVRTHEENPADSAASTFMGVQTPSGAVGTPQLEVKNLSTVPLEILSRPTEQVQPLWQSDIPEDDGSLPDSPAYFQRQQWLRAHHTYESLEEIQPEEKESSGYQTVAEVNASTPHLSDSTREAGSDLLAPPTAYDGAEEGMMGTGLKSVYAQVSKKYKDPTQQSLPAGVEPVPYPYPLQEEEEELAPPVPFRNFEV